MNNLPEIAVKELVLIGGGHSHVVLMRMFAMKPLPGLRITLIANDTHTPYTGMLPGYIAGQYGYDDVHLDLRPLAEFARCRLYHSKATHIDTDAQLVYCNTRPAVKYDVLSINTGSTPDNYQIPGVRDYAIAVKPVKRFIIEFEKVIQRALKDEHFSRIAVIGGGASGVEMILAIQRRLQLELDRFRPHHESLRFTLISASERLLPSHNASVQKKFLTIFNQRDIQLELNCSVTSISARGTQSRREIVCQNDQRFHADAIIWCTSATGVSWPGESGLEVDENGFIRVNNYLQSVSQANIFAAGDTASMVEHPRPKSGVFAVRQGAPLFHNIRNFLQGQPLKPYRPQKHFLSLLNCADNTAVASRGKWSFQGNWAWRYKHWIDLRFMNKFSDFPGMNKTLATGISDNMVQADVLERLQEIPMRCGGCGAKVGSTVLTRVLERLQATSGASIECSQVVIGMAQPDDAAVIEVPAGQLLVQSLDYFKSFLNDPYLLGRIAANHALGDLFAMGATPHSALALVTLPYAMEEVLEDELFQIMSGAMQEIQANNMTLLGGHTGEGSDMAFGLSVNGFVNQQEIMTKSGLNTGDVLILNKPLGTGTLLAANMRMKARGRWIDEAIEHMLQSNRLATEIYRRNGVTSCTDITGFGVLGHLVEMLKSSQVCAQIDLSVLPALSGAHDMLSAGIFSSLQQENIRLNRIISNLQPFTKHQNYPLLFDPQTAGGLLAGVPRAHARQCLEQLKSAGYHSAVIIGEITECDGSDYYVHLTG